MPEDKHYTIDEIEAMIAAGNPPSLNPDGSLSLHPTIDVLLDRIETKRREIIAASDSFRTNWGDRSAVWEAILERLHQQREKWGGPDHDDQHSQNDWIAIITCWAGKSLDGTPGEFRDRMIDVAAVAISAWESSQRKS